jgi:hypothetical protein
MSGPGRLATAMLGNATKGSAILCLGVLMATNLLACAPGSTASQPQGSSLGAIGSPSQLPTSSAPLLPVASAQEVLDLVGKASAIKRIPADLRPPLANLGTDFAITAAGQAGCNTSTVSQSPKDCEYGDPAGANTVVLFGDSHAGMWLPAFDLAARRAHWRVVLLFRPGCAAAKVDLWDEDNKRPDKDCNTWRDWAIGRIRESNAQVVALTSIFYAKDFEQKPITEKVWDDGLAATIGGLKANGGRVLILGDIPFPAQSTPDCLAAHQDDVQACATPRQVAVLKDHNAAEKATAQTSGAEYVDVTPWLCDESVCPAVIGTMGVYRDRAHISATFAAWLSGVIGDVLRLS